MSNTDADLDSLASDLESAFSVTHRPNDPNKPHPRFGMYKSKSEKFGNQEVRRKKILEIQKKRRDDFMGIARDIAIGNVDPNEEEEQEFDMDDEGEEDSMDTSELYQKKYSFRRRFRNQLMESEWMVDVPKDLASNWIMIPVPEGRRCFLIASGGTTNHYSRSGYFINSFPSLLPGGNRRVRNKMDHISFLDCIYVDIESTYYILDVMVWKDFPFYDCDTECRRYIAESKMSETDGLQQKSRINPYTFKILPSFSCDPNEIRETMAKNMTFHPLALDGLLFYNKQVQYLPGSTPLVGWLKGYMVPEMLGIEVSADMMAQRPNTYATMKNYIEEYTAAEEEKKKSSKKNCAKHSAMEADEPIENT